MKCLGLLAVLLLAGGAARAEPVQYAINAQSASIAFSTDGVFGAFGAFARFTGILRVDPAALEQSAIDVTVEDGAITTPLGIGVERLRSAEYFDAAHFPTIAFRSLAVRPRGPGLLAVNGMLTIRGIARPFALETRIRPDAAGLATVTARGSLRRSDYGMVADRLVFSDRVTLTIRMRIALPPSAASALALSDAPE
jgi:polyisoprenoid-binding protein YceI